MRSAEDDSEENGFDTLRAQLGGQPPEGLRMLTGEQLADLAEAIGDARRRQNRALAAAGERALSHIPRLLRGPVRRIVG
ncbi:MAG: hypothetical protein M3016_07205 [Actinomycetota bacterium]|nr:hypothetical protein [Actinomycetota bacterium]